MDNREPVAPDTIYLQRHDNQNDDFAWVWCRDKINDEDVEYVRAGSGKPRAWAVQCQSENCGMSPLTYGPRPHARPCLECGADTRVVDLYLAPPDTKALVEALTNLVEAIEECAPHETPIYQSAAMHGVKYQGPSYEPQMDAARTALAQQGGEK